MNVLVFIQRRSLFFYYSNQSQPLQCMIPETVMNDLEILNEQALRTLLEKFIPPKDPKGPTQALLLLNEETCFSAWLEAGKEEAVKKSVVDTTPFVHIESVTFPFDQHKLYITTNQDLYHTIGRILEAYNCAIVGVYPWVIITYSKILKEGEVFSGAAVDRLFEAQSRMKEYSFSYLNSQTQSTSEIQNKTEPSKRPISTGLMIVIVAALIYLVGVLVIFIRK